MNVKDTESQLVAAMSGLVSIQQYLVGMQPTIDPVGERLLKGADLSRVIAGNERMTLKLLPYELKAAITSTGAINDRLVPSGTPTLDYGARSVLFLQDLLPRFPTRNGAIEIPVLSSKTNNAAPQAGNSPLERENVTMGESAYAFVNSYEPVETIGHYLPVSKQIFEDSGQLTGFINSEMLYGLAEKVEDQLLNGDASTGSLNGLLANASAYVSSSSPAYTNEVDIIRDAIRQVRLAKFGPNGIILNEADWFAVETRKRGSTTDAYVAGDPRLGGEPSLWGLPVHVSNAIAAGTFLVADFNRCGIIFDREEAMIEVSRHDGNSFTTGMVTVAATQRLALVNTNPLAMVKGAL
ncbi:MAG: phage major capsid protein [Halioglobus sp.]|nr:phage major capsid protein [Halioglobus sp.]